MKTFEELKQEREKLLQKACEAMHAPDPFNYGYNAIYANRYSKEADKLLKQMCIMKGIDPNEIL